MYFRKSVIRLGGAEIQSCTNLNILFVVFEYVKDFFLAVGILLKLCMIHIVWKVKL